MTIRQASAGFCQRDERSACDSCVRLSGWKGCSLPQNAARRIKTNHQIRSTSCRTCTLPPLRPPIFSTSGPRSGMRSTTASPRSSKFKTTRVLPPPSASNGLSARPWRGCESRMSTFVQFMFDSQCATPSRGKGADRQGMVFIRGGVPQIHQSLNENSAASPRC